MSHTQAVIADAGIWWGAVIPVLFALHYTFRLRVRWWRTTAGRAFVVFDFAFWVLACPLAVRLAGVHAPQVGQVIRWMVVCSLILGPAAITYRLVAFERKYRRNRRANRQAVAYVVAMRRGGSDGV